MNANTPIPAEATATATAVLVALRKCGAANLILERQALLATAGDLFCDEFGGDCPSYLLLGDTADSAELLRWLNVAAADYLRDFNPELPARLYDLEDRARDALGHGLPS